LSTSPLRTGDDGGHIDARRRFRLRPALPQPIYRKGLCGQAQADVTSVSAAWREAAMVRVISQR